MNETMTQNQSRPAATTASARKEQANVAALVASTSDSARFFQEVLQSVPGSESDRVRFQYD